MPEADSTSKGKTKPVRSVRELYGLLKVPAGQEPPSLSAIDDSIAEFLAMDDERIRRERSDNEP